MNQAAAQTLEKFAQMIERHWEGIAAYCNPDNKVSLGYVEGLNNTLRVLQCKAYGFDVPASSAQRIARFYCEIIGALGELVRRDGAPAAAIHAGDGQRLYFRETSATIPSYDGHHMQIYLSGFSGPYRRLIDRPLISLETDAHEWRFLHIADPDTNQPLLTVEHEVRSLPHPLYGRPLVNGNNAQTNRAYLRGQDEFRGRLNPCGVWSTNASRASACLPMRG